ncbi:MAG: hypothetical protein R3B95_19285 [Nitrospirales bacterium]|nr:hypothetical protein [Nitrospirales bacterium]
MGNTAKTKKPKRRSRLAKAQKRAMYRANLQSVANYFSKINDGRRIFYSAYPRILSESSLLRIFRGMGDALAIFPSNEIMLPARNVNERLERSWYRTGMALYLAMDAYDSIAKEKEESSKYSGNELVTMAMK